MKTFYWLNRYQENGLVWIRSKKLIIVVLQRSPRHLCSNFQPFVYSAIHHVVVEKHLKVRQNCRLIVRNYEHFCIMLVFEDICAKPPFPHSLDVPIRMFANSLAILNQQTLGRTNHVHCFQTQTMKSYLIVWFWVDKKPVCCCSLYKKTDQVLG